MIEKWYWIELIGFDNTLPDYGAESFVSRAGDVYGVSLLFSNVDFVCGFDPLGGEELSPCDCSYAAHPASEERQRQVWTKTQLKGLIKSLQALGVTVTLSFFDMFSYVDDGRLALGKFPTEHPEIRCLDKNGTPCYIVNMLKRLQNGGGNFFDYVARKTREVVDFYGFDGVQFADGISTFRLTVQNGDMSDDLVGQFVDYSGIRDENLTPACDGNPALYKKRRKYIIENLQDAWLAFCAEKWGCVYDSLYAAFEGSGKKLLFNSCWTRDPFEAYLRFGFDYKRCLSEKAYALTVEEVSATAPIFGDEDRGGFPLSDKEKPDYHYEAYLMQQSIKAYMPSVKQITLTPIRDTCEQWDLMRHSPTEQERAIFRRNNNYVYDGEKYINCSAGPLYCLSDSMRKSDWDYLARKESASAPQEIEKPLGYSVVFSDNSVRAEAEHYLKTNRYSSTAIKNRLISAGLNIDGAVRACDACKTDTPLLLTNPEFYSDAERAALDGKLGTAVVIGERNPFAQKPVKTVGCGYLRVWFYGKAFASIDGGKIESIEVKRKDFKPTPYLGRGGMWGMPLKYEELPKKFFSALAGILRDNLNLPAVVSKNGKCVLTTFKLSGNRYRMLISNNAYHYYIAKIKLPFTPVNPRSVLKYDGYKILTDGNCFYDRIPPRGMDVVEFEADSKGESKR